MKKIIFASIILFILTIGIVSANDPNVNAYLVDEDSSNIVGTDITNNFKDLNDLVEKTDNKEINLTKDYKYDENIDSDFDSGIKLEKPITINGQKHIIEGESNRAFEINHTNVTIKNTILKNANIEIFSKNCQIINCTFINGGGISTRAENTSIIDCTFINCSANEGWPDSSGGAIYSDGKNTLINNCFFTKCEAYKSWYNYGGAVYSANENMIINNSIFDNCFSDYGGAVYGFQNITIINSKFINCSDYYYNVAVNCRNNLTLINSSFVNGSWITSEIGEFYNVTMNNVKYTSEDIFKNIKENQIVNLTDDFTHTAFSPILLNKNNISINGNGHTLTGDKIFKITGKNVTIQNCNFEKCSAIDSHGINFKIVNCTFIQSRGISSYMDNCSIINCSFIECYGKTYSIDDTGIKNGAIYSKGNNCLIDNCIFDDCYNYNNGGGAINSVGKNCMIINSSFTNCRVSTRDDGEYYYPCGGAIECIGENSIIDSCNFTKCIAGYGGAIYGENFRIVKCNFKECNASYKGHTIYTNSPTIDASNLKMYYADKAYYMVKLYCGDYPLQKVFVTFKLAGKKIGEVNTDENGYAKIKINSLPKTYKIQIISEKTSITKKITIKKVLTLKKVQIKKSAKKLVITASLKNKKPIANKKITFKFKGKKYTAKTNKKGIAKITIKKSVLNKLKVGKKVNYQATYIKSTVKYSLKVKK